jgi:metal-dependent HD superfamily phosphatase/phosphodiesterase
MVTINDLRSDEEVVAFIQEANKSLFALGYTEHGERHAALVGQRAKAILEQLGYPAERCELAYIASYLHDIGN